MEVLPKQDSPRVQGYEHAAYFPLPAEQTGGIFTIWWRWHSTTIKTGGDDGRW